MFGSLGFQEMIVIGVVAVLLFGKRLPDVARSLGGSYQQFRRGLQDLQGEFNTARYSYDTRELDTNQYESRSPSTFEDDDYDRPTAPKIELPPAENSEKNQDVARTGDKQAADKDE